MKKNNFDRKAEEHALYLMGWVLLLFLVLAAVGIKVWTDVWGKSLPPCMLHKLTGLYCPGCGGTRAFMALFRGRPIISFLYHPLVLYAALIGGWFMISHTIEKLSRGRLEIGMKYRDGWMWGALCLVGANFAVKNILLFMGIDVLHAL